MPINKFTTLQDLARQAKILSGETATFDGKIQAGIPFSGYPTGVDTGTTVSLGVVSSETAVFSGNTGTTIFDVSNTGSTNYSPIFSGYTASTWTNPLFSGNTSGLTLPITPLSADTQIVGPFWTLTQTGMTGDYVIGTQYTGYSITYSFFNVSQFGTGFTYSGFTTASQENFSAGTLDYKGPLDYISSKEDASVEGRLTTNKITITNGASASTIGYVLTQTGENGEGEWLPNSSAVTNTFVTGGTLTGIDLTLDWNTGGSANPIDLSSLEFTGNTSGTCITDLWVRNIHGCSPITIWNSVRSSGSTVADNDFSFALGQQVISTGVTSFATGFQTVASGDYSFASGYGSIASGALSYVEGFNNLASGVGSHAEGGISFKVSIQYKPTSATTYSSHAEGAGTLASGVNSHAEGIDGVASGIAAHAEGSETLASGDYSHAQNNGTMASANYSHAEGNQTTASGVGSHAEGITTVASGSSSHAEGSSTLAGGDGSHAEGTSTIASGINAHAEGRQSIASGNYSHAEGYRTKSTAQSAHAEGSGTLASGINAHADGDATSATTTNAHAQGINTIASGLQSHAGGDNSTASGVNSFVHSIDSNVSGDNSAILGGSGNTIGFRSDYNFIGSGKGNTISSSTDYSSIIGGQNNVVTHNNTHIIGSDLTSDDDNTTFLNKLTVRGENIIHSDTLPSNSASGLICGNLTYFSADTKPVGAIFSNISTSAVTGVYVGNYNISPNTPQGALLYYGSNFIRQGSPVFGADSYQNKVVIKGSSGVDGMVINPNGSNPNATLWFEIDGNSVGVLHSSSGYLGLGLNPDGSEMPSSTLQLGGTGTTGTFKYIDGNQQSGYILTSDANGVASWAASSGGGSFTGNTSGDCISDLWVTNLHSCSPLNINPNDEGNVYIGSNSGFTYDTSNGRLSINGQASAGFNTSTTTGLTETIDWDNGNFQEIDFQNKASGITVTFVFNNPIAGASYNLKIIQGANLISNLTFPGTVKWDGGVVYTPTSTDNAVDIISMLYDGTNYYANFGKNYS